LKVQAATELKRVYKGRWEGMHGKGSSWEEAGIYTVQKL
jgi:hypothetical protein